ncbi:MAG TPA: SGNH/GDSL hydrolase family protein [Streptosporangiaceae bacterium]|nr:SGNH/GDSL hydrolase family protein [Streptosporangiaceae bacterium]
MEHRGPIDGISSFVALGDSFTEGLNDPLPGGGYRGWADRFADMLSIHQPGLRYANLAVRGKLLREVAAEQVPRAIEMAPDLVSLAAGGNDLLRPGSDPDSLAETLDASVASLRAAGCRVLLLSGFDPCAFPVIRLLRGKAAVYNMHMRTIASTRQCDVVDLWSMRVLCDRRVWSEDRLHLLPEGHRRVALRVCEAVGVPADGDWREPLPQAPGPAGSAVAVAAAGATAVGVAATRAQVRLASVRVLSSAGLAWAGARRQDARWAKDYAMPWLRRMLRGQSSGDGVPPKRPDLLPVRALAGLPGLSGLSGADAP